MANTIVDLPVPAGNGTGASVAVDQLARDKTITVNGAFNAILDIQGQAEGGSVWVTLMSLNGPGKRKLSIAVRNMRTRLRAFQSGTPNVDVAAEVGSLMTVQPAVPASPGDGAASSIVDFPQSMSIFCTGTFDGVLRVQVSPDGTSWNNCAQFVSKGGHVNINVTGAQIRVQRAGGSGGSPEVTIAAVTGQSGGAASNIVLSDEGGVVTTLNVRTTGDDVTGDGSLTNPFRTIRRALRDIPAFLKGRRFVINCDGLGTESNTEPLVIGPFQGSDDLVFTGTIPGFPQRGSITIEAAPTVVDSFTPSGNTADPVTGLQTYQTTLNLALNAYQGRLARDANGVLGVIASNTAGPNSDIEVAENTNMTGPIEVLDQAVEIRNSDASGSNAVQMRACQVPVAFNGVRFTADNPSVFTVALFLESIHRPVAVTGCDVGGYFVNGSAARANQPSFSDCRFTKRMSVNGVSLAHFGGYADNVLSISFRFPVSSDPIFFFEMICEGCAVIPGGTGVDLTNPVYMDIDRCEIRNSTGDALFFPDGRSRVRRTNIDGAAADAVHVEGPGSLVVLDNVQGSGNTGLGVNIDSGAQVRRLGGTAVVGAGGEYQVGGNAAGTWGAFAGNEDDIAAAAAVRQQCRLFA